MNKIYQPTKGLKRGENPPNVGSSIKTVSKEINVNVRVMIDKDDNMKRLKLTDEEYKELSLAIATRETVIQLNLLRYGEHRNPVINRREQNRIKVLEAIKLKLESMAQDD